MNALQREALSWVQNGHNLFLGGAAGTGKSFTVQEIVSWARRTVGSTVALTCTTGVACCLYPKIYTPMTIHKWSGLGDGRLSNVQLAQLFEVQDDRYSDAFQRIRSTDLLIIDEISMMSMVMFEKLNFIMKKVRGDSRQFGGCQVVLVGDFRQLPPVRNGRYQDNGEFCFLSDAFPPHIITLKQVMRQENQEFAETIDKIALGQTDSKTMQYVKSLSRPLRADAKPTIRLFSSNILSDIYNRDCLLRLEGDVYEFEALDEGEERHLSSLTVQKTLWLKKNAKVMLLRNLSDQLVNGLCGSVVEVREGEVDVLFPTLKKLCHLTRMNFAVFDPALNRNLAVRNQIPLKLCYAMTVHKAQGMTLDRVEVDCRQIFQPGQLAVAMGRVRSPDGLRVVNFSEHAVIPQSPLVVEFLHRESIPLRADMSCCHIRDGTQRDITDVPEILGPLPATTGIPNYSESDIEISPEAEFDEEFDEIISTIDVTEDETGMPPNVPLPPEFNISEEIGRLAFEEPMRESQAIHNHWVNYLLENIAQVIIFCSSQYSYLSKIYETTMKETQSQKAQVEFFQAYQKHITSSLYKASVLNLMPESDHVNVVFNLSFEIMSLLRKLLLHKMSESLSDAGFSEINSKRQLSSNLTDTAKGKIRYIGGYVIAKLNYRTNLLIQRNAYKSGKNNIEQYESGKRTMKLIHSMKCAESTIQHSDYPESLKETARKQNVTRGLTNITDLTYKFFECLISTVLFFLNGENLNKYGAGLHKYVEESIAKDTTLHEKFLNTIQNASFSECVSFDTDKTETDNLIVSDCLQELTCSVDATNTLYFKIIDLVISVLFKQFSNDVISDMNIKKKLEHRKQIHMSTSKDQSKTKQSKASKQATAVSASSSKQSKSTKKTLLTSTATDDDDDDDTHCPKCNRLYIDGEEWICCDSCDQWLDRKCAGLTNALRWKKFSKQGSKANYYCPSCQ